jgi:hypothetical protein
MKGLGCRRSIFLKGGWGVVETFRRKERAWQQTEHFSCWDWKAEVKFFAFNERSGLNKKCFSYCGVGANMNFFMAGKEMNCRQGVFLAMGRRVELWQGKG